MGGPSSLLVYSLWRCGCTRLRDFAPDPDARRMTPPLVFTFRAATMVTRMAIMATAGLTADTVDMVAATAAVVRMAAVADPIKARIYWTSYSAHRPLNAMA
jgi:hypothetical protein